MRNLTLTSARLTSLPSSSSSQIKTRLSATSIDTDSACLWLATETILSEEDVELTIWRQEDGVEGHGAPLEQIAVLNTSRAEGEGAQVVSLHAVPDVRTLVLVARGGDIATLNLDDLEEPMQVVGTMDNGVLSASWSPDDSSLSLITGSSTLLLLSPTLDVLSEAPLHTSQFGENAPINVGWGSKSTQFHGSAGKAAAASSTRTEEVGASPDDDGVPVISWRPDGALFVVSVLSPPPPPDSKELRRRVLRIYSRDGKLESTSEAVAGLESTLATGNGNAWIASTQRFGGFVGAGRGTEGRHDVVFFERNGLRHGEFRLREPVESKYRVKGLRWSADGSVLAVWIAGEEGDKVQLWTSGNWYWYLKQEIRPHAGKRFESVEWHPERPLELVLSTSDTVLRQNLAWETVRSRIPAPNDTGTVAVLDGTDVLLTPFRTSNAPPPMSAHRLTLPRPSPPAHMSLSSTDDTLTAIWADGTAVVFELNTRIEPARGEVPAMKPAIIFEGHIGEKEKGIRWREVGMVGKGRAGAIGLKEDGKEVVGVREFEGGTRVVEVDGLGWAFVRGGEGVEVHREGKVVRLSEDGTQTLVADLGRACTLIERSNSLYAGLAGSTLFASAISSSPSLSTSPSSFDPTLDTTAEAKRSTTLATNATSFALTSQFVIWTNAAHEAHFAAPEDVVEALKDSGLELKTEKRRIERGARIVVPVPSATALVLQMPRGNLETVHPRPMVGAVVRSDVARGEWRSAFLACRKHRMDLALLATDGFENAVPAFVSQIGDTDYFNLFLTALGQSALPSERVAVLCDALRAELERVDLKKYINAILTAHVVKRPADMEGALGVLLGLRESEPALVEDAVKYVIFLVDANTLFDVALGMYDFALVLMIAQYAQKDPREYLPFLRALRALSPPSYQKFKIDDHLRRPSSALSHLRHSGPEHFAEALRYVADHGLYKEALELWKDDGGRYKDVLGLWGDDLFERREFGQAGVVYVEAGMVEKARAAYERALLWRELFALGGLGEDEVVETAHRVAEDLQAKKRALEAGQVLLDYARDVRAAVSALAGGNEFSEARRVAVLHSKPELVEEIVHPATLDARAQIGEDVAEVSTQLIKQKTRLAELRRTKLEAPAAFYGADADDPALANVDVMTDASAFTAFTRYTVAPSATSSKATSKRSSRSKRKMERKVGSGRKGTVDEEEYLLNSLVKLSARVRVMQGEAAALVPHLVAFTPLHRSEARALTKEVEELAGELEEAVREAWPESVEEEETEGGWAKRMEEYVKDRERAVKSIKRPEVGKGDWKVRLVDFVDGE